MSDLKENNSQEEKDDHFMQVERKVPVDNKSFIQKESPTWKVEPQVRM